MQRLFYSAGDPTEQVLLQSIGRVKMAKTAGESKGGAMLDSSNRIEDNTAMKSGT